MTQSWHLLVADDFHLDAGGGGYREVLLSFFILCALSGVPLSWSKTARGDTVAWVGFEILHRSYSLGISARRAEWFVRWTREMASRPVVNMDNFEEGLGRIMYIAGALEYERPFLAPLYKFPNVHPRGSTRKLPSYVAFILRHLSNQVERERHFSRVTRMLPTDTPQSGRTSERDKDVNRRMATVLNTRGVPDPWLSPWFSVEITQEVLPWVYEKGGKPSLIISTLEALAVLVSLKMFYGEQPESGKKKVTVAPTWTDNRGNGSALNKLMTTKFTACAVLMELSAYMKRMSMKVVVEWTPRAGNREADHLANGEYSRFSPQNRVNVDLAQMQWDVLPDVLGLGRSAEDDVRLKEPGQCLQRNVKRWKRKPDERMRLKDPW